MKRIIVICEGQTEQTFCKNTLAPHLIGHGISLETPLIKKTQGGIANWSSLKKEIEIHLKRSNVFLTTFIDYYGIESKHNFPNWGESKNISDANTRLDFIETSMKCDIDKYLQHRFLPYLQLYEFETLLFCDKNIFYTQVPKEDLVNTAELDEIFITYPNPEMINNNKKTSPSHRLERIINGYDKVLYGDYLAEAIGINKIRSKATRFNTWVEKMINL